MIAYDYAPDGWALIKIQNGEEPTFYKVFGSWRGGYLDGDTWRMNSGVVSVSEDEDYFYFFGQSGSCYRCYKKSYGYLGPYCQNVIENYSEKLADKFEPLTEMPDIMKLFEVKNDI